MVFFVFIATVSGCSGVSDLTPVPHSGAAGIQETPQSIGSWTTKAPMPTAREGLAAGVVNGILYAIGGDINLGHLKKVEAYDPATNTWTTKAPMPTGRDFLAAGVVNGILYAVGGYKGGTSYLNTVEAYTPR